MNKCRMVAGRLTERIKQLDCRLLKQTVVGEVTDIVELVPTLARDILAAASYVQIATAGCEMISSPSDRGTVVVYRGVCSSKT
jgi:hypothetical protein